MYISKKELLQITGISYGQLYRWKRENLIPEEWFVKQSSKTGQETFFPREKVLKRIRRILELKDQYSLEELSGMLSPEISSRIFTEEDLEQFEEIEVALAAHFMDVLEKDSFTFTEILLMAGLTKLKHKGVGADIRESEMFTLIDSILYAVPKLKAADYKLVLLQIEERYYMLLEQEGKESFPDNRIRIIETVHLEEMASELKLKYKEEFAFVQEMQEKTCEGEVSK